MSDPVTTTPETEATVSEPTSSMPTGWQERVGTFALAVGKTVEQVSEALKGVIGEPSEDALSILANSEAAPDSDIKEALRSLGIPSGKINMHLAKLRGPKVEVAATAGSSVTSFSILPAVPDETSFIEALKVGGVLKVGVTEVLAAVKAALATRVDLFNIPEKLLARMEAFAESQEEPWGEQYFKMQRLLTEKKYGEVLSVLGVPGSFMSERRKNEFLTRLDGKLWGALASFQGQLSAWQQAWVGSATNPGALMLVMASGQGGAPMPPGLMAPPDTAPVRTSGEEVVNVINRVFAGPGIPVSRALAYDATRIMNILEDPSLPSQVGASTREQMLKDLGVAVGPEIVRTERTITQYALAIMSLPKVTAESELAYLAALIQLGATIPWDKLEMTRSDVPTGIGRPGKKPW